MAEENNNEKATQTDIFQQQKKVIDTLVDELARQAGQPSQIVYASPAQQTEKKAPNYLLYIGLAAGAYILLKR